MTRSLRARFTRKAAPSQPGAIEVTRGMADCIFGFGVILANAGLVTRDQLAEGFAELVEQLEKTGASEPRLYLPRTLRDLYAAPVVGEPK